MRYILLLFAWVSFIQFGSLALGFAGHRFRESAIPLDRAPVFRLVQLTEDGWSHVCTSVAIVGESALTAGHCLNMFVTVRVGPAYYYITGYKRLIDEGIGRDLGIFRFRSATYDGPRASISRDVLLPGTVLWFVGYPRGVLMSTKCIYRDKWPNRTGDLRFGGVAKCDMALAAGASGGPLFFVDRNEFVVAGIVTHLHNVGEGRDSSHDIIFTLLPDGLKLLPQ